MAGKNVIRAFSSLFLPKPQCKAAPRITLP
jgi:hypothetical protein